jgi:carboxypeptidase Q
MKKKWLLVSLMFTTQVVIGQQSDSAFFRSLSDEILLNSRAYENLGFLTKKIGNRLSGSASLSTAIEFCTRLLREAGADTVYMQKVLVPTWQRGGAEEAYVMDKITGKRVLNILSLGGSVATTNKGLEAEVVEVESFDQLASLGTRVAGKIVFYNYPMQPVTINAFTAYVDAVKYRTQGAIEAAKLGALAVIVRSTTFARDNNAHTGSVRYDESIVKIPAVAISTQDAEWLHGQLNKTTNVRIALRLQCRILPPSTSYNVIGELRGKSFPKEVILVGAHLDSWDVGEGAHDDGAGCMHSIEVIRALRALQVQTKRTIRVVLFTNEENGVAGGREYALMVKGENTKHLFAIESDAGGFTPRGFNFTMNESQFSRIRQWQSLFSGYGGSDWQFGYAGTDIAPLGEQGVALAGFLPDTQRYFDVHHSKADVFENVNKRELLLGAINIAGLAWLVSEYGLEK